MVRDPCNITIHRGRDMQLAKKLIEKVSRMGPRVLDQHLEQLKKPRTASRSPRPGPDKLGPSPRFEGPSKRSTSTKSQQLRSAPNPWPSVDPSQKNADHNARKKPALGKKLPPKKHRQKDDPLFVHMIAEKKLGSTIIGNGGKNTHRFLSQYNVSLSVCWNHVCTGNEYVIVQCKGHPKDLIKVCEELARILDVHLLSFAIPADKAEKYSRKLTGFHIQDFILEETLEFTNMPGPSRRLRIRAEEKILRHALSAFKILGGMDPVTRKKRRT